MKTTLFLLTFTATSYGLIVLRIRRQVVSNDIGFPHLLDDCLILVELPGVQELLLLLPDQAQGLLPHRDLPPALSFSSLGSGRRRDPDEGPEGSPEDVPAHEGAQEQRRCRKEGGGGLEQPRGDADGKDRRRRHLLYLVLQVWEAGAEEADEGGRRRRSRTAAPAAFF